MKEINYNKQMKSVWQIKPPETWEKKHGKHPTQKPVALLERILLASTNEGDLVLDPFAGGANDSNRRSAPPPPSARLRPVARLPPNLHPTASVSDLVQVGISHRVRSVFS